MFYINISYIMRNNAFQPQINQLVEKLSPQFADMEFFKEGCAAADIKTNLIWKNNDHYLKAFTKAWLISGKNELDIIQLFNTFSEKTWSAFSWPEIIEVEQKDDILWFLMNDIEQSGKQMIDFSSYDQQELINIYLKYREEFSEFEKFTKWKITTNHNPKLQKYIHSIQLLEKKIKLLEEKLWILRWSTKYMVENKQQAQINSRIDKWKQYVQGVIDYDKEEILKSFSILQKKIRKYDFDYSYWRFWTWHVFTDGQETQLIDFDNVWYQIAGSELVAIIWSNLLYSVEDYNSYDEWKLMFEKRYKALLDMDRNQKSISNLLLFQKIIWTIFMDYWNLSFSPDNIKKIENKWISPEMNRKKWVEWNYKLLQEVFDL